MNWKTVLFAVAVIAADRLLARYAPKLYRKLELPGCLFLALVSGALIAIMLYSEYQVLFSGVSAGDKVFFTLFTALTLVICGWLIFDCWKRWRKACRKDDR